MSPVESHSEHANDRNVPGRIRDRPAGGSEFGAGTLTNLGDVTLLGLTIRGKKLKALIEGMVVEAKMNRTIEGASTVNITLNDYQRKITNSALAQEASEIILDGMKFVLVKVRKTGNRLQLTFEDWAVVQLRGKKGPRKANRAQVTRAQFAEMLVKEVKGLKFYSPEKAVKQDVYPYDRHGVVVNQLTPTVSGTDPGAGGGGGGGAGAGTRRAFADEFLRRLNKPTSGPNMDAMIAWMAAESGGTGTRALFNPMNTTQNAPGATAYNHNNGYPVKNYPNWDIGMKATIDTITSGNASYGVILNALQAGNNAMQVCVAIDTSDWGTKHASDVLDDIQADRNASYNWPVAGATTPKPRNVKAVDTNQMPKSKAGQEPGFPPRTTFTIQGTKATNQQIGNLGKILNKANAMDVNWTIQQAVVLAAITDSRAYNLPLKDSPTRSEDIELWQPRAGIFQFRISDYPEVEKWTIGMQAEKFIGRASYFYDQHLEVYGEVRVIHRLANDVTRRDMESFDDYGRRYLEWAEEARNIVQLFYGKKVTYGGQPPTGSYTQADYNADTDLAAQPTVVAEPYEFSRGTPSDPEDSWTCLQRLADEVNWRCFSVNGTIYFVRDKVLLNNKALDVVQEFKRGVGYIDFDYDVGKPVSSIEVECRAERWSVPPGEVVVIEELGPATGRYIVQEFTRSMHSDRAKIQLIGETPQLKEPAPDTHIEMVDPDNPYAPSSSDSSGGSSDFPKLGPRSTMEKIMPDDRGARGIVEDAYAIAKAVGGAPVYVMSAHRPGSITTGGTVSDHSQNNAMRAARDIGRQGMSSPSEELDKACVAIGAAFGFAYPKGATIDAHTFQYQGYRCQVIWRTPKYGGHMNHIHVGCRK